MSAAYRRRNPDRAYPYTYLVVCNWCRPPRVSAVKHTDDPKMDGAVSHSICPTCAESLRDQLAARKRRGDR